MRSGKFILKSRDFLVFILLSYALVISIFVDAGLRNYLVLFAAMLGGAIFFVFSLTLQRQAFWALLLFSFMTLRALFLEGAGQLGSIALTFVYSLGYFAIASLLERVENKRAFLIGLMRWIICAFAILSVCQMVTSFVGLPIPNVMATKGLWSYNSLAYEPSQLGRVVGITMLCYLMLIKLPVLTEDPEKLSKPEPKRKVLIAFIVTMLLSGSALASVAMVVVLIMSRSIVWGIAIMSVSVLLWPVALLLDYEPLQRVVLLASNLGSLDVQTLLEAEPSGAVRIIPAVIYLTEATPADVGFWFGYGDDGLIRFFFGRLPGLGDAVTVGFIPGFIVLYGMISMAIFIWVFGISQANSTTLPLIGFWLVFMATSAWNTQVFWYGLIVIHIAYAASRETDDDISLVRA